MKQVNYIKSDILHIGTKQYEIDSLTFNNLRVKYECGQSYTVFGSGRNKVKGYRRSIMTEIGEIEISDWEELMKDLIIRSEEWSLQEQLRCWCRDNCYFLHSEEAVAEYSLRFHSHRIFEHVKWKGYEQFYREYYPKNQRKLDRIQEMTFTDSINQTEGRSCDDEETDC